MNQPPLTEEQVQQILGLGTLDERSQLLQQQLAQAQALTAHPMAMGHSTGLGAALGGIGDMINAYRSGGQTARARQGLGDILNQKDQGVRAYYQALQGQQDPMSRAQMLVNALRGGPAQVPAGAPDDVPSSPSLM